MTHRKRRIFLCLLLQASVATVESFQPSSQLRFVGAKNYPTDSYLVQSRTGCRGGYLLASSVPLSRDAFFLSRIVFLRSLAFVYGVAFLVAKHQNKPLIGDSGITPARTLLDRAQERGERIRSQREQWLESTSLSDRSPVAPEEFSSIQRLLYSVKHNALTRRWNVRINHVPRFQHWRERLWDRQDGMGRPLTTLLWLAKDRHRLDPWLDNIANTGLALSTAVFLLGAANVPLLLGLWVCQRSLMAVGGPFYGYGWEPQLAELGFHSLFLVPLITLNPIPIHHSPPSPIAIYAIRLYLFRIMLGAGLIKLRSHDLKWKWPKLSAMSYFYETQPVPNSFSKAFHFLPYRWHQVEVLTNHLVELIVPWMLLMPTSTVRRVGGLIQILFQAALVTIGNLSFLNWLTAIPAILCLDDAFWGVLFSSNWKQRALEASWVARAGPGRKLVSVGFALLIGALSVPVFKNLWSKHQLMNSSFDPLRLVNSYGAFGTVNEEREEYIISAASGYEGPWLEYEFKVKPGRVDRKPRLISPYHYRLDWQMWIAATIGNVDPWMYSFLMKLLERDPGVLALLESDPFENHVTGPKYIRVDKYRYSFNDQAATREASDGKKPYWKREMVGRVFPRQGVASKEILRDYCK